MQITPETAKDIERQSGGTTFEGRGPLRPRNQHPLRDLRAPRTARTLRRRRGRGAGGLQRRPRQRRQLGRQRTDVDDIPFPETRAYVDEVLGKRRDTATSTPGSWLVTPRPPTPRRRAGPGRRPRPGRLLGGRPGPARHLPRFRRQRRRGHLGAGLLQPGDGAGRGSRRALARRVGPGRTAALGLAIFAGAGLACGLADNLSTLILARCVQALGGAAAVTAALELLPATVGSERRAARSGPAPGRPGRRSGPAVGGMLTELVSWQSIFLIQVPVALAAAVPILAVAKHEAATGIIEPSCAAPAARISGQHRPGDGLGGDRRGAVPAGPAADRRLAPDPDRGRDRGHGDAAGGDPRQPPRPARPQRPGPRRGRGDPRLRRPRRPRLSAQGGGGADRCRRRSWSGSASRWSSRP